MDFCKAGLCIEFISSVSYDPFEDPDLSEDRSKYSFEREIKTTRDQNTAYVAWAFSLSSSSKIVPGVCDGTLQSSAPASII